MTAPEVTDADLAAVPAEYRRTVARWLLQRGGQFRESWVCPAEVVGAIRDALSGAAVDIAAPGSEDSTVGHAVSVVDGLAAPG